MKRNSIPAFSKTLFGFAMFLAFSVPAFSMPPMSPEDEDNQCMEAPCPPECGPDMKITNPTNILNLKKRCRKKAVKWTLK